MCLFSSLPRPDAKAKAKSELRTEVPHFHLHITGYYFSIPNLAAFTYIKVTVVMARIPVLLTTTTVQRSGCHGNMFDNTNSLIQQLSD